MKEAGLLPLRLRRPRLALALGEKVAPGVVLRAPDLGGNESIDGLVGNEGPGGLAGQATGHLLGRPALLEAGEDARAQGRIKVEPGAAPAARAGLLVGIARLVALRARPIALKLPSQRRWRAIQTCSDLLDRVADGVASGQFTAVFNGKVRVVTFHGNTLMRRCTSFVNLGRPLSCFAGARGHTAATPRPPGYLAERNCRGLRLGDGRRKVEHAPPAPTMIETKAPAH